MQEIPANPTEKIEMLAAFPRMCNSKTKYKNREEDTWDVEKLRSLANVMKLGPQVNPGAPEAFK